MVSTTRKSLRKVSHLLASQGESKESNNNIKMETRKKSKDIKNLESKLYQNLRFQPNDKPPKSPRDGPDIKHDQ